MGLKLNDVKQRAMINGYKLNAYLNGNKIWGQSAPEPEERDYFQFTALETGKVLVKNRWEGYINVNGNSVPNKGNIAIDVVPGDLIIVKEGESGVFKKELSSRPALINELIVSADKSPKIEMFSINEDIIEIDQFAFFDFPSSIQRYSDTFLDDTNKITKLSGQAFYQAFTGKSELKYSYLPKSLDFSGVTEVGDTAGLLNIGNYRFGSTDEKYDRITLPVFNNTSNRFYVDYDTKKLTGFPVTGLTEYKLYLKDPLTDEEYYSVPAGQRLEKFGR